MALPLALEDYHVSPQTGFLPTEAPLERLPNSYYDQWEWIIENLQGLVLSKRLREAVDKMEVLSTEHLLNEAHWRRAYSILAFVAHAYIWGGSKPCERVPPPISVPFVAVCDHLELPYVATYAGLVLWNWKPIFGAERHDTLTNLDTIHTFTGSLDEKWFYLISIAIEAQAAPTIPLMLRAIAAAEQGNRATVKACLQEFAERLDDIGQMLLRMYDQCDPHVFYHRIRPYLAGSKNMADAGLPNGVVFDNGGPMNKQRYVHLSGGSNAQSSILQFFDLVLGVSHRKTGTDATSDAKKGQKKQVNRDENFIHEMRKYMPGPHARFLEDVSRLANIRSFVQNHSYDRGLTIAFDASLVMLTSLRDKHIQMVSRYIVVKSREVKIGGVTQKGEKDVKKQAVIAPVPKAFPRHRDEQRKSPTGTGGTSLISFLRQARDETSEPVVDAWTRRLLNKNRRPICEDECETLQGGLVWSTGGLCLH